MFKNWFIDFEPFKDGEFIDSPLGLIPKGWKVKNWKSWLTSSTGRIFIGRYPMVTFLSMVPVD